jgi:hypothetical protein
MKTVSLRKDAVNPLCRGGPIRIRPLRLAGAGLVAALVTGCAGTTGGSGTQSTGAVAIVLLATAFGLTLVVLKALQRLIGDVFGLMADASRIMADGFKTLLKVGVGGALLVALVVALLVAAAR